VVDGGLAILHIERCPFEEEVGLGRCEPIADVSGGRVATQNRIGLQLLATQSSQVEAVRIGEPAQASRGDAGNAEGDAVAVAEFGFEVCEQAGQRPVDVTEAEEAEIVGADGFLAQGLKP
jgi:hypothetical protein